MEEIDYTLNNGTWVQRNYVQPTSTQMAVLTSFNPTQGPSEEYQAVMAEIQSAQFTTASPEVTGRLQEIYDANFPVGYELIGVDITLPDGRGIINARQNLDHKQVRF